jgi:hypothetical protein
MLVVNSVENFSGDFAFCLRGDKGCCAFVFESHEWGKMQFRVSQLLNQGKYSRGKSSRDEEDLPRFLNWATDHGKFRGLLFMKCGYYSNNWPNDYSVKKLVRMLRLCDSSYAGLSV